MAVVVNATITLNLTALETLSGPQVAAVKAPTLRHDQFNQRVALNGSSTPPVAQVSEQTFTNTQTVDLTALPTEGGAVNCTGLKARGLLVTNPATNHGALVIGGGSNPYLLAGAVSLSVPLGATVAIYFADGLLVVGGTNKLILFTPNNAADTYNVQLLVG